MTNRITFFVARYSSTGVPLAQIRLAKALHRRGYVVEFIIGYIPAGLSEPEIDGIHVVNLDVNRTYKMLLPIVFYLRKKQPDVIFSAEDHLNAIVALAAIFSGSKAKLSASSRITPYRVYSNKIFTKKWFLKQFSILVRRRIDALICVSEDMVKEYDAILGPSKYQCIYNVIQDADTSQKMSEPVDDPWFKDNSIPMVISAGTLSRRKGFADLIFAMKIVTQKKAIRLTILGEGHLRLELQALIQSEGLSGAVRLLGFHENPLRYFSKSNVFVLSSYAEGMPNVLVEAMMCGCTPVSTDCPTGPRELLQEDKYGYLVPMHDPEAMAAAIERALDRPISPALLAEAVRPFAEDVVIDRHFEVLGLCQKSST
jgi:glycosyltransferase involved in cell wall biosynthesis